MAKLANHTAKRLQAQTGGVVDISDSFKRDWVLRNTEVKAVRGVARRMTAHLEAMGIHTVMDLAKADARTLRRQFSVVMNWLERLAWSWTRPSPRSRKSAASGCSACA